MLSGHGRFRLAGHCIVQAPLGRQGLICRGKEAALAGLHLDDPRVPACLEVRGARRKLRWPVEAAATNQAPWGAGFLAMSKFDELYCAHVEQIGVRYPDAWHVRYAWVIDPRHIESKVYFGDESMVFTSVLDPDGTIRHFAE